MNYSLDRKFCYGWIVIRQGSLRRMPETFPIESKEHPKFKGIEAFCIFPSKRSAIKWIDRWINKDDFDFFRIKIPTI